MLAELPLELLELVFRYLNHFEVRELRSAIKIVYDTHAWGSDCVTTVKNFQIRHRYLSRIRPMDVFDEYCANGHNVIVEHIIETSRVRPQLSPLPRLDTMIKICANGHIHTLELLYKNGYDLRVFMAGSPLIRSYVYFEALGNAHLAIIEYLYEVVRLPLDTSSLLTKSIYYMAAASGNIKVVKYLYEKMAIPIPSGETLRELSRLAWRRGHDEMHRYLESLTFRN